MTEYDIIKGCLRNDTHCQRLLFEQFAGKMMTVCLRYANDQMEAEDMLQDGFVRVFSNLHQFKFEGSFEGWVRRVIVNVCLKQLQRRKLVIKDINEQHPESPTIGPYAYTHLGQEDLLKLINQLPEGYRVVFNLNVIEGYSHEEIGNMLGIQPGTSRSQLVKARKMLQNQIIELQKIAV